MSTFSVIIPACNAAVYLRASLEAIGNSSILPCEVIVVDDGSTDETVAIAAENGTAIVRTDARSGPATARNAGAKHATGDVLVFVDADVCVHPDAFERMLEVFAADPGVAAVFGAYDARPTGRGAVSRFRNLLHAYTHQTGKSDATTFWAGLGGIRARTFHACGGFRARYAFPAIEDVELGLLLSSSGERIRLDASIQGTHQKRWTLGGMVRTDVLARALPWSALVVERGSLSNDLAVSASQRVSVALAGALVLAAIASVLQRTTGWLWLGAMVVAAHTIVNRGFYRFVQGNQGVGLAVISIPLLLLFHFYSGAAFAAGLVFYKLKQVWKKLSRAGRR